MPIETSHDPRVVLKRDKYFSLRPQPLEQWLWRQGVAPSAERVFWLHWQEGMRNADWCSEIPIRRVAQQCCLDVSTVTRAYQLLIGLGLIRRVDPGRNPANPFQQATAITEVRVPRELLVELNRHPNRPRNAGNPCATPALTSPPRAAATEEGTPLVSAPFDPFAGLPWRQRLRALAELTALMSARERRQFNECQRLHQSALQFDEPSRLNAEQRGKLLQWLQICARTPAATTVATPNSATQPVPLSGPRRLTVFELARLRRELTGIVDPTMVSERLRETVWSIEEGALRRFQPLHAIRIALKKMREGAWARPNRMPPNWARPLGQVGERPRLPAQTELCETA
jgi:hypothetical protein